MKNKTRLPKVSFIIMSYNGGEVFARCLQSIRSQNYPKRLIEIVVVDDNSQDKSLSIAKKFKARTFVSGKHDMYLSWGIALHKITGDFVYMVDQDIELKSKNFVRMMVKPLTENPNIVAAFTRMYPRKDMPWITRYISYHPFQCDPIFEYLTPPLEPLIVKKGKDYSVCHFQLGKIPAESRMMYKVSFLKKTPNWNMKRVFDHDLLVKTLKSGFDMIAYVPRAGLYHHHAQSLSHLLGKRVRNITSHYLPYQDSLEYKWIDTSDKKQIIKLGLWVIYANLFFPATIRGFFRFLKYKDWALLMEPIVVIATTDVILWTFLKTEGGRKIIGDLINPFSSRKTKTGAYGI